MFFEDRRANDVSKHSLFSLLDVVHKVLFRKFRKFELSEQQCFVDAVNIDQQIDGQSGIFQIEIFVVFESIQIQII